ncbi:hypothetical protein [Tabrizicola sp.]|uniref:hypothetical protein n=1 Tax=Tabrizicola sp. TaxID=2005166 RepID=UPI00286BB332|nr:hypothetical protein [Tabrizicola sp.]
MNFRWIAVVCLWLAVAAHPARADLTDQQPSFTKIAAKCGQDPSKPSFSKADYAQAKADAEKALRQAKKDGKAFSTAARQKAIADQLARVKECEKEEANKYTIPPIRNCREFIKEINAFAVWVTERSNAKKISDELMDQLTQKFAQPANNCMRDIMTRCVDPTDTKVVLFVVDAIEAARTVGGVESYARQTGVERFLSETNPGFLRPSFCTDTDYACKGDPEICADRVGQIKKAMQTYIKK